MISVFIALQIEVTSVRLDLLHGLRSVPLPREEHPMDSLDHLRHAIEDDASEAVTSVGASLPITDVATLSIVLGRMVGGPVTEDDVARALDGAYVTLPIETPGGVLEALNRILDIWLGENEES